MSWWEYAYRSGDVPWDPGAYDGHLPSVLDRYEISGGTVLDPGCGNGKSAVWLGEQGFHVTGIDLSSTAIGEARSLARRHAVSGRVEFYEGRFPEEITVGTEGDPVFRDHRLTLEADSFDLITERAFLQHLGRGRRSHDTVTLLAKALKPHGYLYSLMIASEGTRSYGGIVRWSEKEIRDALEPRFTIIEMRLDVFTPGEPGSVPAWLTIGKRR